MSTLAYLATLQECKVRIAELEGVIKELSQENDKLRAENARIKYSLTEMEEILQRSKK